VGKRARGRDVFGLLLLDKPPGASSNQALQRVRRLYDAAKAGHGGSLDPLATGMLPIFFGAATRLAGYLLDARKAYRVTARFGTATDTGDAEGAVIEERAVAPLDEAAVAAALPGFHGEIEQVPPMYSALKRGGVPLYRLARRGLEVARERRRVTIDEVAIEDFRWPDVTLRVRCSKGTYVRTFVEDLARGLGTVAHVAALRRLWVEPFEGASMRSLPEIEACAEAEGQAGLDAWLLPADSALVGWASVRLDASEAARLAQGQALPAQAGWPQGKVKVYGPEEEFLAIGTVTAEAGLAPERVFRR